MVHSYCGFYAADFHGVWLINLVFDCLSLLRSNYYNKGWGMGASLSHNLWSRFQRSFCLFNLLSIELQFLALLSPGSVCIVISGSLVMISTKFGSLNLVFVCLRPLCLTYSCQGWSLSCLLLTQFQWKWIHLTQLAILFRHSAAYYACCHMQRDPSQRFIWKEVCLKHTA